MIRCVTYGGRIGWFLRKHFSKYTSWLYLEVQYILRKSLYKQYIKYFNEKAQKGEYLLPCLISIETINRCNSECEFCPANRNSESRPFAKMSEELFKKIISELSELDYSGYINLYLNNEPFMDTRIEEWYKYASEKLPNAKMLLYTNGTLLTIERFKKIAPYIDKMFINNYTQEYKLHDNLTEIFDYIKSSSEYDKKDITIQIRYIKEILTNRAGEAPNKGKRRNNNKICIMPFTDLTIFPNGTIGLCCSDALEKTNYGNVMDSSLYDIWTGEVYATLREKIGKNRSEYSFCKGCDFVDAGIRNLFIKNQLSRKS